jgi:hypothetical protein
MMDTLDKTVRQQLELHPSEDSHEIAERVFDELLLDQVHEYMVLLLAAHVRQLVRWDSSEIKNKVLGERPNGQPAHWSPKYENRPSWRELLDSRENVDGVWKRLGECTRDELVAQIEKRTTQIERLQHAIENYTTLIAMLDKFQVNTPDEIPATAA